MGGLVGRWLPPPGENCHWFLFLVCKTSLLMKTKTKLFLLCFRTIETSSQSQDRRNSSIQSAAGPPGLLRKELAVLKPGNWHLN
jgi:hypothetical protein